MIGLNEATIKKYIQEQEKHDIAIDKLSVVNINIKMYKKWKIKMYNLGSTIHQLSYHQ